MYRKKQLKIDGNILFTGNHLRVAVVAVVALVLLLAAPGWAQSTDTAVLVAEPGFPEA